MSVSFPDAMSYEKLNTFLSPHRFIRRESFSSSVLPISKVNALSSFSSRFLIGMCRASNGSLTASVSCMASLSMSNTGVLRPVFASTM